MRARAAQQRAPRAIGPRVPPGARRSQLIAEAARLLTEHGVERVQITEVAERAGVSRPLVYRLFPTQKALVHAVLQDFADSINQRFRQVREQFEAYDVQSLATAFIEASCDAIEQKGAGPWLLLDPRGADPEMGKLGRAIFVELLDPWQQQLGTLQKASPVLADGKIYVGTETGSFFIVRPLADRAEVLSQVVMPISTNSVGGSEGTAEQIVSGVAVSRGRRCARWCASSTGAPYS